MSQTETSLFVRHGVAMHLKVGVMGAATGDFVFAQRAAAAKLHHELAQKAGK